MSDGAKGDFFTINWGWGVSVTLAVLISGGVSGGHVNPAVTVAMSVIGKLPLIKVVPYMISQVRHLVQGGPTEIEVFCSGFDRSLTNLASLRQQILY